MNLKKLDCGAAPRIAGAVACTVAAFLPVSTWAARIVVTQRATVEKITFADTSAFSDAAVGGTTTLSLFGNAGDTLPQNYLVPDGATGFSVVPGSPDFAVSAPVFTPGIPNDQYAFLTTAINAPSTGVITIGDTLGVNVAPAGAVKQFLAGAAGGYYYLDGTFNPVGNQTAGAPFSYKVVIPGDYSAVGISTGRHQLVNLNPAWTIDKNFLFNGTNTVFQAHIDVYDPTLDQIQLEIRIYGAPVPDVDGDGIADAVDNCINVSNADQRDTDGDGYGNLCDPDFNNDGVVNINDFNRLKARLGISPVVDVDADLDGNGAVNINDLNRLKSFLGKPPGASGLHPNCPPTCP